MADYFDKFVKRFMKPESIRKINKQKDPYERPEESERAKRYRKRLEEKDETYAERVAREANEAIKKLAEERAKKKK